jgi:uroporphyrinogen decarboxylase
MMTPRERWLALLNGEKPDRVPTDYWATDEVTQRLCRELGCADPYALYDKLEIDGLRGIGARPTVTNHPSHPEANMWGVRKRRVEYETGSYWEPVSHPLADATTVEEIDAFAWPDSDSHDWEAFQKTVRELPGDRAVRCGGYEPFLLYCQMRGMEQAMMDLLTEPDIARAIFRHIFDFYYTVNARMWDLADGRVDIAYVAEDLGSQSGLLMSLEAIREFILPNQKRMADLARQHGIHIFYHTDGAARDVIPDLIDVTGIEVLNPIQWRCPGMEREGLVRDFGDRIVFHGAVDNQQTLPFGTPADVEAEVVENLRIFAWPTRYICAPCHNLQANTSTENILTLYRTAREHGI